MADEKFDRQRVAASESEPPSSAMPTTSRREADVLYAIARLLAREAARDAFETACAGDASKADQS